MKHSHFPMENIQRKIFQASKKKCQKEELWEMLGISKRSIILGNKVVIKKVMPIRLRPKTGRYDSTRPNKHSLPNRTVFFDPRTFKEGLSFIYKVKNTNTIINNKRICPQSVTKNKIYSDIVCENNENYTKSIQINNNESDKEDPDKKNQSQQTFFPEEYTPRFNITGSTFFNSEKEYEELCLGKRTLGKITGSKFKRRNNLSAWDNELEHLNL
ncbi:hypothetical protein SteCoe_23435 [Stentor coeruleus]|uniref:Uncharacterized protein n=1 Tax=Stentor coeruleus TaxID=5963 RepID=A0A1R2BJV0_9CILI|nr:hypothetical protein SteCoe_23435 [Stentor coeruleus]